MFQIAFLTSSGVTMSKILVVICQNFQNPKIRGAKSCDSNTVFKKNQGSYLGFFFVFPKILVVLVVLVGLSVTPLPPMPLEQIFAYKPP